LYLLESWGVERFLRELERRLQARLPNANVLPRWPLAACEQPPAPDPAAHIGFHNQKPRGKSYVGVVLADGLLSVARARGLASIASDYGTGELRLTPQQNLLVLGLPDTQIHRVKEALSELGLSWSASAIRAGLLACTGSVGCPLAAGDVKRRADELAQHLESRFTFEQPLTIRISGCHHGCAEHGIADIGLLALRGAAGVRDAEVYQLFLGGEPNDSLRFGKELASGVPAADVPEVVQGVVASYFEQRQGQESFREFVGRLSPGDLRSLLPMARLSQLASSATAGPMERAVRP
jgi:ferredoxin-nitrite reductase